MYLNESQIHENVAGRFILFLEASFATLGPWIMVDHGSDHKCWCRLPSCSLSPAAAPPWGTSPVQRASHDLNLLLRWVHWDGKTHSIVKMHKESKGAWHSITNHDISSFPWNHTKSTHESPLILRAVEKPTLSRTTECWLGGWMAECLLHSLRYLSTCMTKGKIYFHSPHFSFWFQQNVGLGAGLLYQVFILSIPLSHELGKFGLKPQCVVVNLGEKWKSLAGKELLEIWIAVVRRKVWNQFRWVKFCPTFFKLPRCCFSSWPTVWKKNTGTYFYWTKWYEQLKHALTCFDLCFDICQTNSRTTLQSSCMTCWLCLVNARHSFGANRVCHQVLQNASWSTKSIKIIVPTSITHSVKIEAHPFRRDPCNRTPKVIMWPLWMWRIFGILVVKSHMSTHPKKLHRFPLFSLVIIHLPLKTLKIEQPTPWEALHFPCPEVNH